MHVCMYATWVGVLDRGTPSAVIHGPGRRNAALARPIRPATLLNACSRHMNACQCASRLAILHHHYEKQQEQS
eukprot:m.131288 g.131288  ORF g.131288 m.131288 type:complete len:73 (+) comp9468_c0_seq1:882-1100(+)